MLSEQISQKSSQDLIIRSLGSISHCIQLHYNSQIIHEVSLLFVLIHVNICLLFSCYARFKRNAMVCLNSLPSHLFRNFTNLTYQQGNILTMPQFIMLFRISRGGFRGSSLCSSSFTTNTILIAILILSHRFVPNK